MSEQTAGCGCHGCRVRIPELEAKLNALHRDSQSIYNGTVAGWKAAYDISEKRAEQAEAELGRMREALEDLASGRAHANVPLYFNSDTSSSSPSALWREIQAMKQTAEEALKPRATEGGGER